MAYDFNHFKKNITSAEDWLKQELQQIRTGQASPALLDGVRVESYGALVPLKEVASVTIEGARTLRVSPWDKSQIKDIDKAITVANLGLAVATDDQGLRVNFPELTSDRRKDFVKLAKDKLEDAKRHLRGHRDQVIKDLQEKEKAGGYGKDEIFRLKGEAQKMIDEGNKRLEDLFTKKEREIQS